MRAQALAILVRILVRDSSCNNCIAVDFESFIAVQQIE